MSSLNIVQKLWNYCNVLRDDGMSYGDYVEQLTYLLFLKMADERTRVPYNQASPVPEQYGWPLALTPTLSQRERGCYFCGDELFDHYRHTLEVLGNQKGLLGLIFNKSQNKFDSRRFMAALTLRAPCRASNLQWRLSGPAAKLRRLVVDLIENAVSVQANVSRANVKARRAGRSYKEQWVSMSADVKGDAYEGLLEKNAQDTKSGAGQYFTPRPLIQAIVDVMAPKPGETVSDPACGTGGFLLAAHDHVVNHNPNLTRDQRKKLMPPYIGRRRFPESSLCS